MEGGGEARELLDVSERAGCSGRTPTHRAFKNHYRDAN